MCQLYTVKSNCKCSRCGTWLINSLLRDCNPDLVRLVREDCGGDCVLVALKHGHGVDGLAEVPQPESRVLRREKYL